MKTSFGVRLVVTIVVAAAVAYAQTIRVPGVVAADEAFASVAWIGLTPVLTGYCLVEVVAAIVPRWRPLRHGGPVARGKLERAVAVCVLVLALVQAIGVGRYIDSLPSGIASLQRPYGAGIFVTSLVGGTFAWWIAARAINRHGLVNGYVAIGLIQLVPPIFGLARASTSAGSIGGSILLGLAIAIAICLFAFGSKARADQRPWVPIPAAGLQPITAAMGVVAIPAALAAYRVPGMQSLVELVSDPMRMVLIVLVAMMLATLVVTPLLFRPRRVADALSPIDSARDIEERTRMAIRRAMPATLLFSCTLVIVPYVVSYAASRSLVETGVDLRVSPFLSISTAIPFAVAFLLDAIDAAKMHARGPNLVCVWEERRAYVLPALVESLATRGIVAHARNVHVFALHQFFGPHVPAEIFVDQSDAQQARAWLEQVAAGETSVDDEKPDGEDIERPAVAARVREVVREVHEVRPVDDVVAAKLLEDESEATRSDDELAAGLADDDGDDEDQVDEEERTAVPVPPSRSRSERLREPALAAALAAALALAFVATRREEDRSSPRTPVKLELYRLDDDVVLFDPRNPVPLLGASVQQELAPAGLTESGSVRQVSTHFVRIVLQPNETLDQLAKRADAWVVNVQAPFDREVRLGPMAKGTEFVGMRTWIVTGSPILTNADIEDAQAAVDNNRGPTEEFYVAITLKADGAERFRLATREWTKRRLAIVLDGRVDSAPVVQSEIGGGHISITLGSSPGDRAARLADAKRLAHAISGR